MRAKHSARIEELKRKQVRTSFPDIRGSRNPMQRASEGLAFGARG